MSDLVHIFHSFFWHHKITSCISDKKLVVKVGVFSAHIETIVMIHVGSEQLEPNEESSKTFDDKGRVKILP